MKPTLSAATGPPMFSMSAAPSVRPDQGTLREFICEETLKHALDSCQIDLRAIVLTGSLARNEATFIKVNSSFQLLGDAEFLLIYDDFAKIPSTHAVQSLASQIERASEQRGVSGHIDFAAVPCRYLRRLKPTIFAYELKTCGKVLWGKTDILSLIDNFSSNDIPPEDGWRLLCNRMIEMLEAALDVADRGEPPSQELYYRTIKLCLDIATSFLLFAKAYKPSYAARARRINEFAEVGQWSETAPFSAHDVASLVTRSTQWKLNPTTGSPPATWDFWCSVIDYAQRLWNWEMSCLTGLPLSTPPTNLWRSWMSQQAISQRARGWLSVLRRRGLVASRKYWPRWARLAARTSPRFLVYSVASEVFSHLPTLLDPPLTRSVSQVCIQDLKDRLPEDPLQYRNQANAEGLIRAIVWNYHHYLTDTTV